MLDLRTKRTPRLVIGLLVAAGLAIGMIVFLGYVGAWASASGGCGGG